MAAFSGDGSSPESEEVFPEKIEPDIIDISNSPAFSSSSSTILLSPKFRPSNVHQQSPRVIVHTHTLLAITCGEPFKINSNMNVLYRIENDDIYSYILNIFGWSNKTSEMLSDVHLGSNKLMLAIYKHNSVVFNATVFYPYLRKNSVIDTWEYDKHAFIKFIPQNKNYYDKPWGENGYYSSTVTHVKYYFEYLLHSYENFKDAMEYHNFY